MVFRTSLNILVPYPGLAWTHGLRDFLMQTIQYHRNNEARLVDPCYMRSIGQHFLYDDLKCI